MHELPDAEVCCGFGGTFCVKYPEISTAMSTQKVESIVASGVKLLAAGDMGCLLNLAGALSRQGSDVEVRHVVELLQGAVDVAPIGGQDTISGQEITSGD